MKPVESAAHTVFDGERILTKVVEGLIAADAKRLAHVILKAVRLARHDESVETRHPPATNRAIPKGPFVADEKHDCALLIYIPLNLKSHLIDDATGAYGYSHVAIDCGEIDQETGKRVMTESTTQDVVHRGFQDKYGTRPFVRIPLRGIGVDCQSLRECVNAKLGEQYDAKEALTWGAVDDPAKQVCSDLAGDCLPSALREDIARQRLKGALSRSSVSVHRRARRVFISPNGFCEYFGAPRGEEVERPDQLVVPRLRGRSAFQPAVLIPIIILTIACGIFIGLMLRRGLAQRIRLTN